MDEINNNQQQQQQQNDVVMPGIPDDSTKNNPQELMLTVEELVEELRKTIIVVEEFQTQSQSLLFEKLGKIISLYRKVENQKNLFDNLEIPLEIFRVIDQSKNPDLYVKETLQNCLAANERTKGKIESIKSFKDELDGHIANAYPDEYKVYLEQKNKNP
ncbi:putative mediator complex subunit 10 [Heterostelium album PN500]|uniref:Mediator of RNA polymerase II transcription subunit 10 n=1 Tax=Heterostelium pallidum (strain ATCC 26659 / Pp 5 / PN500) TaxID=670386 RepID=D3AXH5_HETP5|nr:putative mediator complex subunit 10 [Heterostelium album PN500]EFA86244.1 putative mediator complex subunit 10 [Heterostelium album PN500]|eukprot:XP_020438349.1 putative mediator complex subunit 10 [Heterostelium album PN500]